MKSKMLLISVLGICCSLIPGAIGASLDNEGTSEHHRVSRQVLPLFNLFGFNDVLNGADLVDFVTHQDQLLILSQLDLDRTNLTALIEALRRNATAASQITQLIANAKTACNAAVKVTLETLSTGAYYFSSASELKNWFEAKEYCRSVGLELVSIETAAENDVLVARVKQLFAGVTPSDQTFMWIGLNDLATFNTYMWTGLGKAATYFNWLTAISTPSQICDERCVEMFYYSITEVRWNDRPCNAWKGRFICERPPLCTAILALP